MRVLSVLAALLVCVSPSAQIAVVASYGADTDASVLLGAEQLDADPAMELVFGVPSQFCLSDVVIRDGATGAVEWRSSEIGPDLCLAAAGWAGSYSDASSGVSPSLRFGDSPFADVDGDRELVLFDRDHRRLYVVGSSAPAPNE